MRLYFVLMSLRPQGRMLYSHRCCFWKSQHFNDVAVCLRSGSHHRKQELVKELQRNGVPFDIRKLNVGDFLWVAREKVSPVPGSKHCLLATASILHHNVENRFSCSVSRSATGPCRKGARPWLHHREEEDRRPVRQYHWRTLQGTEGQHINSGCQHIEVLCFLSVTLELLFCSVPAEEVRSVQAHLSGGTTWERCLPPEFTRNNPATGHRQHPGVTPALAY